MQKNNSHFLQKVYIFIFFSLIPLMLSAQKAEKMIIVSPTLFSPQLNAYIAAKESDNIHCNLILVDSAETFQSVKQKIAIVYANFQADFLLLIGDFEYIPSFQMEERLSDMQYGILSEDSVPAMAVGRFSAETEADLQTMIERSLAQKNCSKTVVGIASKQRSELTQLTDFEQVKKMGTFLENKGFRIASELFEGKNGTSPDAQEVINALNQGITWVNYAGNGSYQGWNTSGFSNHHIDSLKNSDELPIILSAACLNGYFAQRECFAEKWMRAVSNGNPIGARAVIMSSSFADWDAILSGMLLMCENLPSSDSNCRLGTLYLQAYQHIATELKRKKEADCWLLFGDPSLRIYPTLTKINEVSFTSQSDFLFPNPAKNTLTSRLKGHLQLFDLKGNILFETILQSENESIAVEIPTGVYIAILQSENGLKIQKLVVLK